MNQQNINHDAEKTVEREEVEHIALHSIHDSFRLLSKHKKAKEAICHVAQQDVERIQEWKRTELKKFEQDEAYHMNRITQYHQHRLAHNPKAKTINTPWGKSKTRASKESVEKVDEKKLLQFSLDNNYKQFIEPKLKWSEMKKALHIVEVNGKKLVIDESGQHVHGASVKPESISHSLEVS